MQRLTLSIFGAAMFGTEIEQLDAVPAALERYLGHAYRIEALISLGLPERIGLAASRRFAAIATRPLRALCEAIQRQPSPVPGSAATLLAMARTLPMTSAGAIKVGLKQEGVGKCPLWLYSQIQNTKL